jgi:hypothetical protein
MQWTNKWKETRRNLKYTGHGTQHIDFVVVEMLSIQAIAITPHHLGAYSSLLDRRN